MKKLLFYSHDSYGLGNIRRMVSIATYLVSQHQDLFILLVTGSPMYHAFRTHPQIDYVKLPCLSRDAKGVYHSRLKCFDTSKLTSLRRQLILDTFNQFKPDICLIDKKPTGLSGELNAIFEPSPQQNKCKFLLLLRDILDSPTKTQQIWTKHQYHSIIAEHYHEVMIVGDPNIFDLPREYDFPSEVREKTSFCGYLINPNNSTAATPKPNSRKKIVVAVGGGDDGHFVIDRYLQSLMVDDFPAQVDHHIVLGPEMNDELAKQLTLCGQQLANMTIERFNPNLVSLFQSADVTLSMAGYNTVCELLSTNTKAILLPRTTPVEEQLIRAQRLAQHGYFDYLCQSKLTPESLVEKVRSHVSKHRLSHKNLDLQQNGMRVVEDKILSHLF